MKITPQTYQRFNRPDTLLLVSSFPLLGEEIAKRNAVARYSHLLLQHFPKTQKVVVFCEQVKGQNNQAYLLDKHILIIPTFSVNSLVLFTQLNHALAQFFQAKKILVQFEFSLFGKELITFLLPFLFLWQKFLGKKVYLMLHQVVLDLSILAGQVQLPAHSLKTKFFNLALKVFYQLFAFSSKQVLVHDQFLAKQLSSLLPANKITIIPHGINGYQSYSAKQKALIRKSFNLKTTDQVLLAYGYHSWYKGTDFLVKNFLRLKKEGKIGENCKLLLAGDVAPTQKNQMHLRQYYADLSTLIKNHPQEIIHTGFVPEEKVAAIFAIADLLVFPYRACMSSSGALALAMQYRKTFICSDFFLQNLLTPDLQKLSEKLEINFHEMSFKLNYAAFAQVLQSNLQAVASGQQKMSSFAREVAKKRDWSLVAEQYLQTINSPVSLAFASQRAKSVVFSQPLYLEAST